METRKTTEGILPWWQYRIMEGVAYGTNPAARVEEYLSHRLSEAAYRYLDRLEEHGIGVS